MLGRRRGICRGLRKNANPAVECLAKKGLVWGRKGPWGTDRRAPSFSIQGGSMTRIRITGILLIVLALAVSSLAQAKKQVDINSASEEEMVAVGIEKATAKKIIESRPYRNKAELVARQLLTRPQYDKLKDLLVARQPPSESKLKPVGK
jgi:Helix-hairpin-helix motif